MRNLTVVDYQHYGKTFSSVCKKCPCLAIDSDNEHVYCATDRGVTVFDMENKQVIRELDLRSTKLLQLDDHIVGLHYRLDDMSLCIALSSGDILSSSSSTEVELVGSIAEGISAMSWSPDGELLVIFSQTVNTEQTQVYIIICDGSEFQPLTDFPFASDNFGEAELITVGWGKKETQFHGSEGKHAATKKEAAQVEVRPTDDGKARIRWIGDGRYFAISAIDSALGVRKIRVWTREGILHSTSELLTGLEHSLDWRPSGNLIASSQTHKNKHDIIFFERNGLRHGEFTLPFAINTTKVREVSWNNESNILCVWMENMSTPKSYVQLWTMSNYHWYLKQSLEFTETEELPVYVMWDILDASILYILCANGALSKYYINWTTTSNSQTGSHHETVVIDGNKLYVTPFSSMVVPPPMCAYSIELSSCVACISFSYNQLAILLMRGDLLVYEFPAGEGCSDKLLEGVRLKGAGGTGFSVRCNLPQCVTNYSLPASVQEAAVSLRHLCWLSRDVCMVCTRDSSDVLIVFRLSSSSKALEIVKEQKVGRVKAVCSGDNKLLLQYKDGSVWLYRNNDYKPFSSGGSPLVFPVLCNQMQVCTFAGKEAVVGLSLRYRLFINTLEIATNCTSFAVHDRFLLFTSHNHTIRCLSRNTSLDKLTTKLTDGKAHIFDETVRRVERGSRIVTCVTDGTKVVLQMPRGNLEVIHPRALVLSTIRTLLDRLEYKQAFMLMHRHRIKMNLICDHNRKLFLDNVYKFISQVETVSYLNQFISDLCEEDVTSTMYTAFYDQGTGEKQATQSRTKVDMVCYSLILALKSIDFDKYLFCILTAYVRKTEPELETSLTIIKALSERSRAEEALKYLTYLVDINELFDVALGMYDFDLVLLVAEKSQKDPKEYLLFLNEVRQLETNYQRYTIDRHLKRYSKALVHIAKCGSTRFAELLSLVKEHNLYREALELHSSTSQGQQEILLAFADYLKQKKKYEEAGILYAQADQHRLASECLLESASWQLCVISLQKLSLSNTEYLQQITLLSEKLKAQRAYGDAATLLEFYAKQPEEAITTLITGSHWSESMRLIEKYGRHDFIETDWKPAVKEHYQQLMSSTQTDSKNLLAYKDRFLAVLQTNKAKSSLIGEEYRDVDADLYSDTSSVTGGSAVSSTHSRSTGRTSKNQRKAQRKKWSLKEGSKFEDLALLDEMKKLVVRIDSMRDDMRALLLALVSVQELDKATKLQDVYSDALTSTISIIPEVWSSHVVNSSAQLTGEQSTVNSILKSMAALNTTANPAATSAEIEVKRAPVVSSDSTWRLAMLAKLS